MTNKEFNNKEKGMNIDANYSKIYSGETEETNKKTNNNLINKKKNIRKDGKGIPIVKKKLLIKKSKHHAYLKDDLISGENIAQIIDIPSYKKYNIESEIIEEEDEDEQINNNKLEVNVHSELYHCQCCNII